LVSHRYQAGKPLVGQPFEADGNVDTCVSCGEQANTLAGAHWWLDLLADCPPGPFKPASPSGSKA
jgi:hypothetical protein